MKPKKNSWSTLVQMFRDGLNSKSVQTEEPLGRLARPGL